MEGIELWRLCDLFQRFTDGYAANVRWVRQAEADKALAAERAAVLELVRGADTHADVGPICDAYDAAGNSGMVPYGVELGWNLACKYIAARIEARGKE